MKKAIGIIAVLGFIADQTTKFLIESNLSSSVKIITDFFYLTYAENTGGAWSILDGNVILLSIIGVIAILVISNYISKSNDITKLSAVAYGLLIGGIFGNLFDRILKGYVVDFFEFIIFDYHFPIFNIADSLIVIGVFLLIIDMIRGETNEAKRRKK